MKNFKKVLSLALAALMVIGGLVIAPVDAQAADEVAITATTPEGIVDALYAMENGATSAEAHTLTGTVTGISYMASATEVVLTMVVDGREDKPISGFKLKANSSNPDAFDEFGVGDKITVTGKLSHYYNSNKDTHSYQFVSGSTIDSYTAGSYTKYDNATALLNAIKALEIGDPLPGRQTVTATITQINVASNGTVISFYAGGFYFPKVMGDGIDTLKYGDTVTISANFYRKSSESYRAWEFSTLLSYTNNNVPEPADLPVPDNATDAEIAELAHTLAPGKKLLESVTLTGVVDKITYPYEDGAENMSAIIKITGAEDYPILCYKMTGAEIANVSVGDTLKVSGVIKNFNGTIEFDGCTLDTRTAASTGGNTTDGDNTTGGNTTTPGTGTEGGNTTTNPNMGDMNTVVFYIVLFAGVALVAVSVLGKKKMA